MKLIALERVADGGVSIARPTYAHIFGLQAGLDGPKINELQRALIGMTGEEAAALERQMIVGAKVTIKSDAGANPAIDRTLEVLISSEEAVTAHAGELMQSTDDEGRPLYRRFVLVEETALPPRDTRDSWRIAGDRVVAA